MALNRERERGSALLVSGLGGTALGAAIATLLAARPARAAPTDEKLDYLIEVLTTLVPALAELSERQAQVSGRLQELAEREIDLIERLELLLGAPPEERAPLVITAPWAAKESEEIFQQSIRVIDILYSDKMVDCRQAKRVVFFVQSTLDQDVQVQVIGNITATKEGATDIGPAKTCPARDNISLGPAWDQWLPYIGVKVTATVAPTSGVLTITAVRQE